MEGPPLYEVVQNQQQPQSTGPQANTGSTAQQTTGPQQPTQMQNSTGPGQAFLPPQGYPQPIYYVGNPYSQLGYTQDPFKMAYPNLPVQQYMTVPQPVANFPPTAQQVVLPNYPMVIQQQPTLAPTTTVAQPSSGDNYLTLSVVMTFLVLILGGWPSLLCSIAALLISQNAKEDERRGNIAAARSKANISLGLNVAAVVFCMVMWSVVAIPVAVTVSSAKSSALNSYTPPGQCFTSASSTYYCTTSYCSYSLGYCSYSSYYTYSDAYTYYSYGYYYYSAYCYQNYYQVCS